MFVAQYFDPLSVTGEYSADVVRETRLEIARRSPSSWIGG